MVVGKQFKGSEAKHSKQGAGYYADLHPGLLHGQASLKTSFPFHFWYTGRHPYKWRFINVKKGPLKGAFSSCSCTGSLDLGFTAIALVSGSSLASLTVDPCLGAQASLSQGGFRQGGSWEVGRTYGFGVFCLPFNLLWILPVGGGTLAPVPCPGLLWDDSGSGPLVPGKSGWFWLAVP